MPLDLLAHLGSRAAQVVVKSKLSRPKGKCTCTMLYAATKNVAFPAHPMYFQPILPHETAQLLDSVLHNALERVEDVHVRLDQAPKIFLQPENLCTFPVPQDPIASLISAVAVKLRNFVQLLFSASQQSLPGQFPRHRVWVGLGPAFLHDSESIVVPKSQNKCEITKHGQISPVNSSSAVHICLPLALDEGTKFPRDLWQHGGLIQPIEVVDGHP
mmetsp:Transcript_1981/g.7397  ORF Transcript_1981/g.7397 Transcript_1981/m.7397 type:complete len:215 (-) Transcript_1981:511-1155(-)